MPGPYIHTCLLYTSETTVGMSGAGSFKMEQVYVNVPELDVYFYALDGDGNSYSPIKVQAAGPELTLGDRRLEVRSVAVSYTHLDVYKRQVPQRA